MFTKAVKTAQGFRLFEYVIADVAGKELLLHSPAGSRHHVAWELQTLLEITSLLSSET